ncbi:hypothetical protein BVC93_03605 [Mycobacterium sp. MS1601]|uniref:hypothetical protein n=1 Tax=Mycobacterium sp. MS1601 TaxID=1936029 RepID=UPI0009798486|nr:hypothetical protein [Mycobacterium sp. MS1601]AQA01666.1 hypothetical protein BVC93_03605 [Mycobacterium sp. MS1601]
MRVISKNFTAASRFKAATVGTLFGGSLLFTAGMGIAGAEPVPVPVPVPDGLVNVTVGGTAILENVPAEVASNASAAICGSTAADVSALAEQVDTQGVNQTVCSGLPGGDLVLAQNVSAEATSPVVPETESGSAVEGAAEGTAEAPTDTEETGTEGDLGGAGSAEAPAEGEEDAG